MTQQSKLLNELRPTIIKWINANSRTGSASATSLDRSQAPWVATDIAAAISAHENAVDPHSQYVHVSIARTVSASHTFSSPQNIKAIRLTGSIDAGWTDSHWGKSIQMPGQGYAVMWPKGAYSYSWGIGATGGVLYVGHSTADNDSAAPVYDLVMDGTFLRSINYASRTTGWAIDSLNGAADFQYLFTKQMHAEIFVADVTRALAGVEVVTKSVTLLGADFLVPYPGTTATLKVKDLPSAAGMQVFEPGDYVNPPTFDRSAGSLTIGDCWGTVSSPVNNGDGTQNWTFTRTGTVAYKTISQRGTVVGLSSTSTSTVSLAKPTGTTTGDVLMVQIDYVGTHTLSSPVSYPFARLIQRTTGTNTMEIWYRVAGSSEPASYDFAFEAACNSAANITAWVNVGVATTYIDDSLSQLNASSTSMTVAPGLTPRSGAGMLLFYGLASGNIRATPPSGMTELADAGTGSAQHYLASQLLSSAAATGTKTATLASAAANVAVVVLLMPGYTSMSTQAGAAPPFTTITAQHGNEGAVLDYGVAGNGYVEINAIDGVRGINSPYTRIVTFSGHPADSKTVVSQLGNLRGLFGVTGEYGLYVGDGTGVTNKYFRVSSYTQEIHNLPIKMFSGSTLFMQMDTGGMTYYVTAAGAYADATSILFKRQSDGTTEVMRLAGRPDVSGGHEGSLILQPGTTNSLLHINSRGASGYYANISITCEVGSTVKEWLFQHLSTGVHGAYFPGFLNVSGGTTMPLDLVTSSPGPYSMALTRSDISFATRLFNDGTGIHFEHRPSVPDTLRFRAVRTPASASASGTAGDFCYDGSYFYICTATNTWRRASHATW